MSERNGSGPSGTAEIPMVRPGGGTTTESMPVPPEPAAAEENVAAVVDPAPAAHAAAHATAPVSVRPTPRIPRRGPLTVMGPWAPVAGAGLGLVLGLVTVLLLVGSAHTFQERLALALVVVGLGILGTGGTLLADEVRMLRQQARDAAVRPGVVEATAGLLNGLTPARLLVTVSAFVLFLAAFVSR
jgi:hypothetical protein